MVVGYATRTSVSTHPVFTHAASEAVAAARASNLERESLAYSKGGNLRDRLGLFNILGICDTSEQSRGGCDLVELHCEIPIPAVSSESGGEKKRRKLCQQGSPSAEGE